MSTKLTKTPELNNHLSFEQTLILYKFYAHLVLSWSLILLYFFSAFIGNSVNIGSTIHRHTRELHEAIDARFNATKNSLADTGINFAIAAETLPIVAPAEPKPQSE